MVNRNRSLLLQPSRLTTLTQNATDRRTTVRWNRSLVLAGLFLWIGLCAGLLTATAQTVVLEKSTDEPIANTLEMQRAINFTSALDLTPDPIPHDAILLPTPFKPFLIGPYAGPDYTVHRGNFTMVEDGIVCCTFDRGTGLGFTAGLKSFLPFGGENFLSPRLAFTLHNGAFQNLSEPFPLFGVGDTIEDVRFRDELTTPLPSVAFDLMYCYRLGLDSTLGLYAIAGPGIEYIAEASFTKTEGIAVLDGVTYLDGTDERQVEIDYAEESARVVLTARAGISLLYKLSETLYLNPEVTASLPITVVNDNWRMFEIQGTFGLIFGL